MGGGRARGGGDNAAEGSGSLVGDDDSFDAAARKHAVTRAARTGDALPLGTVAQLMAQHGTQSARARGSGSRVRVPPAAASSSATAAARGGGVSSSAALHRAVLFKYACDCVGIFCGIMSYRSSPHGSGGSGAMPSGSRMAGGHTSGAAAYGGRRPSAAAASDSLHSRLETQTGSDTDMDVDVTEEGELDVVVFVRDENSVAAATPVASASTPGRGNRAQHGASPPRPRAPGAAGAEGRLGRGASQSHGATSMSAMSASTADGGDDDRYGAGSTNGHSHSQAMSAADAFANARPRAGDLIVDLATAPFDVKWVR